MFSGRTAQRLLIADPIAANKEVREMGETYQSIVIKAPVEKVWEAIRDFHDLGWASNVVTSVDIVGDADGHEVGAQRVLNGAFHETLLSIDEEAHTFSYSIDEGPGPLERATDYVGRVAVKPAENGGGTLVEWSSSWNKSDEAVYELRHPIYVALLEDLKQSLE
jgi:carbon monoxide dehydrogenase subunit G